MKQLLYIAFIITSLTGFSQEKKGGCSAGCHLFHDSGDNSIEDDHFTLEGFTLSNPYYYGGFYIDSSSSVNTTVYGITLPYGDSLNYSASWYSDGLCNYFWVTGPEKVDSIFSILEGDQVPVIHGGHFDMVGYYSLSQRAVIRNPCLIQIKGESPSSPAYLIRVKFLDPVPQPEPDKPLTLWEALNELYLWSKDENTISVKAGDATIWEMNLYSLSGQVIQKHQFQGSQDVDISKLPKGCYIAHISPENGKNKQLKFVK